MPWPGSSLRSGSKTGSSWRKSSTKALGSFPVVAFAVSRAPTHPSSEERHPRVVGTEQWKGPISSASPIEATMSSFSEILRPESPQWAASIRALKIGLPIFSLRPVKIGRSFAREVKFWNSPGRRNSMFQFSMQESASPASS